MTSKLEDIRSRLAAYEAARAAARAAWIADKQNTHEVNEVYFEARDWMEGNAPDDLRALLAVVEAATVWREKHEAVLAAFKTQEPDNTREAYEAVRVAQDKLVAALAELTEGGA